MSRAKMGVSRATPASSTTTRSSEMAPSTTLVFQTYLSPTPTASNMARGLKGVRSRSGLPDVLIVKMQNRPTPNRPSATA